MPQPNVYCLDENAIDQVIVERVIRRQAPHVEFHSLTTRQDAWRALCEHTRSFPSLLLMEVYYRRQLDTSLLDQLARMGRPPFPIIILSADLSPQARLTLNQYSIIDAYLKKPFSVASAQIALGYMSLDQVK